MHVANVDSNQSNLQWSAVHEHICTETNWVCDQTLSGKNDSVSRMPYHTRIT